jgi:hypothetical protein
VKPISNDWRTGLPLFKQFILSHARICNQINCGRARNNLDEREREREREKDREKEKEIERVREQVKFCRERKREREREKQNRWEEEERRILWPQASRRMKIALAFNEATKNIWWCTAAGK